MFYVKFMDIPRCVNVLINTYIKVKVLSILVINKVNKAMPTILREYTICFIAIVQTFYSQYCYMTEKGFVLSNVYEDTKN